MTALDELNRALEEGTNEELATWCRNGATRLETSDLAALPATTPTVAAILRAAARRLTNAPSDPTVCAAPRCEKQLKPHTTSGPPPLYCSPKCRQRAYRSRLRDESVTYCEDAGHGQI